jgi:hypothetical protein
MIAAAVELAVDPSARADSHNVRTFVTSLVVRRSTGPAPGR